MNKLLISLIATAALAGASSAYAQEGGLDSDSVGPLPVTGNVPTLCSGGAVTGGDTVFALGVLIDTTTGLLRTDLAAPPKVLAGSFCNTRSTINVAATPMVALNFVGTPPAGFSSSVNYTASASGWTTTPATFTTGAATNTAATQERTTAFTGNITVGVAGFSTVGGPALRLISDPVYQGNVIVTLAAVS